MSFSYFGGYQQRSKRSTLILEDGIYEIGFFDERKGNGEHGRLAFRVKFLSFCLILRSMCASERSCGNFGEETLRPVLSNMFVLGG
ncbi:hypothetical protein VTL71DRAFT_1690 [Oculimacula yallundae]|uniref:Uncharacterized protein n=1 Tax=Oculimacula yallundae TaxID=86028 RepID=A0ABR4CCS2_9HELO